ncbi:MAG: DUF4854 domain-containing protein [Lachnospiraceae bacterium]|nr:DUF4854 domain-containing protein [Lachnospiraceae bacterium]
MNMKKSIMALVLGLGLTVLSLTGCGSNRQKAAGLTGSTVVKEKSDSNIDSNAKPNDPAEKTKSGKTKSGKTSGLIDIDKVMGKKTTADKTAVTSLEEYMKKVPGAGKSLEELASMMENDQVSLKMSARGNALEMILTLKNEMDEVTAGAMKTGLETSFSAQEKLLKSQLKTLAAQSGLTGLRFEIIVNKNDGSELLHLSIQQD